MPRLVEGTDSAGTLRAGTCARDGAWGRASSSPAARATMPPPPPAWAWCRPGEAFVSLGTSGVLFAANDGFRPDPESAVHAFCHALPGTWHQMGVILAGHRFAQLALRGSSAAGCGRI